MTWNSDEALVAWYQWRWGAWRAMGGSNPDAIDITTALRGWFWRYPVSIDFNSSVALDSVVISNADSTYNYAPATMTGYGLADDGSRFQNHGERDAGAT